jgi:hypothetical protein
MGEVECETLGRVSIERMPQYSGLLGNLDQSGRNFTRVQSHAGVPQVSLFPAQLREPVAVVIELPQLVQGHRARKVSKRPTPSS